MTKVFDRLFDVPIGDAERNFRNAINSIANQPVERDFYNPAHTVNPERTSLLGEIPDNIAAAAKLADEISADVDIALNRLRYSGIENAEKLAESLRRELPIAEQGIERTKDIGAIMEKHLQCLMQ